MKKFWQIIIILGMLNWFVYVLMTFVIGGDAVNGFMKAGHYYLAGKNLSGNHLTEVSAAIFTYSTIHSYSVMFSAPFIMWAAFMLNRHKKKEELSSGNIS